jgi:hypothetical protein
MEKAGMVDRFRVATAIACVGALLACKALKRESQQSAPAATASAAAPAAPTDIAFTTVVPKNGTKVSTSHQTNSKFTMDGKVYRNNSATTVTFEVQSSDEFRVTKAALDVKELYTITQEGAASEKKTVNPLAGSRYTVTRSDDGTLSALDSNGAKIPASQLKLIKEEFGSGFEKDQTGAFLPDRPVKIGEKLNPASDSVLRMLEIKDDGKTTFDGTEFILRSATPERATFDVAMTMTQKLAANLRLRAKLKGTIDIKPAGTWLLGVDLKGPLTLLDGSGKEKGTGDLSVSGTQTYE